MTAQIVRRASQQLRIILEVPDSYIAGWAQQPAHLSGGMGVVDYERIVLER